MGASAREHLVLPAGTPVVSMHLKQQGGLWCLLKTRRGLVRSPPPQWMALGPEAPVLSLPRRHVPCCSGQGLPEAFSVSPAIGNSAPRAAGLLALCLGLQGASRGEQWRCRGHSFVRGPALQLEAEELPSK